MDYSNLYDLVLGLSYGTNLHIGVLFFGHYGNQKLILPYGHTIHTSPVCNAIKNNPDIYPRCYRCRNAAIEKAIRSKKAFGGICINGVYEYTRPVTENGDAVCVIFIGNILTEGRGRAKIERALQLTDVSPHESRAEDGTTCPASQKNDLLLSMEKDFSFAQCDALGALLESYIRMLLAVPPAQVQADAFDPLTENLKNFIESNLEYDIELSRLAKAFHYNARYLGRLFKKKTGQSFREYINLRRVQRAKTLLLETDDTVLGISSKLGFNNVTYFNRVFMKHFGMTPTAMRGKTPRPGPRKTR